MTDTRDSLQSLIDAPLADQLWAELNHAIGYIAPTSLQGKAAHEWVESLALRMNLVAKLKPETALQAGAGDGVAEDKKTIHATLAMQNAGASVLFDKQFENSDWKGKIKLTCPKSIAEYCDLACNVYFAMEKAKRAAIDNTIATQGHDMGDSK